MEDSKVLHQRIGELEKAVETQCADGNWNYDHYMFGMANGLLLALAIIKGETPKFLTPPLEWLCENSCACSDHTANGKDQEK